MRLFVHCVVAVAALCSSAACATNSRGALPASDLEYEVLATMARILGDTRPEMVIVDDTQPLPCAGGHCMGVVYDGHEGAWADFVRKNEHPMRLDRRRFPAGMRLTFASEVPQPPVDCSASPWIVLSRAGIAPDSMSAMVFWGQDVKLGPTRGCRQQYGVHEFFRRTPDGRWMQPPRPGPPPPPPGERRIRPAGAGAIDGLWEVCLEADPEADARPPRVIDTVAGFLMLSRAASFGRPWTHVGGRPDAYGTYTIDLARLGIGRDPRLPVPLAGARLEGDSLRIVLDPFGSHGSISLEGRLAGDTVRGRWWEDAYVGGHRGTFRMSRLGEDRLPLPYPVGGPLQPPPLAGCPPGAAAVRQPGG